jgi:membrane-bound inhibitor of C-type lysozyme|tara:strand:+ start:11709 stop:12086 length:378 start_codon:yes stop_codon:yes gene_type:complete
MKRACTFAALTLAATAAACAVTPPSASQQGDTRMANDPAYAAPYSSDVISPYYECGALQLEASVTGTTATVMFNGEVHQLQQVEADKGMRYQSGIGPSRVVFWDQGRYAVLQQGTTTFPQCTRVR